MKLQINVIAFAAVSLLGIGCSTTHAKVGYIKTGQLSSIDGMKQSSKSCDWMFQYNKNVLGKALDQTMENEGDELTDVQLKVTGWLPPCYEVHTKGK